MRKAKNLRLITTVYWFLLIYIVAALLFWLISLERKNHQLTELRIEALNRADVNYSEKLAAIKDIQRRNTIQYIGEGVTFLVVILVGAVFVYRATRKQIRLSRQEQNFMMAITHELKTPVAVAQLNVETLQKRNLDQQKTQRILSHTLQELERLNELCNNVLYSAQLESPAKTKIHENIDFSATVSKVVSDFRCRYSSANVIQQMEEGIMIMGDELALQIMVSNLLENAIKYAGKETAIEVKLARNAGKCVLKVADLGPGIPDSEKNKVLRKFYRVGNENQRTAKGTGLGLFLCKKIAEEHNGNIQVLDNKPKGTIIAVELRSASGV